MQINLSPSQLKELLDVDPAAGDGKDRNPLIWNNSTQKYELSQLGLGDLSNVSLISPVNGSVPIWNSGKLTISNQTTDLTITDGGNF